MPPTLSYVFNILSLLVLVVLMPQRVALGQSGAPCQDQGFMTSRTYDAGYGNPETIVAGDLNGDGKQDMVVGKYGSNLSVFLGDGAGGFEAAREITGGTSPEGIVIADFNGDGRQDLATANQSFPGVTILLGDGTGGFGAPQTFRTGSIPFSIVTADFNGDGKLDLAVSNFKANTVSILMGDGQGGFGTATNIATGMGPRSLVTGDFNGDGKLDLALVNYNSAGVYILTGNGAGEFGSPLNVPVDANPISLTVGDFNSDGKLDLAVVSQSNTLTILLGTGSGSFNAATHLSVGSQPTDPSFVQAGDFDLDGKLDLAIATYVSSKVLILKGDGTGGFGTAVSYPVGLHPNSLALADFDGDGRLDIAAASKSSNNIWVLRSNSEGGFLVPAIYPTEELSYPPIIKDFNGDGNPDVAVPNYSKNTVSILLANGSGGFAPKADYPAGTKPGFEAAGDFNGDGKQDLALTSTDSNTVSVLLNNGSGGFGPPTTILSTDMPYQIAAGDFNGDGKQDIALTDASSSALVDKGLTVLLGNGDGTFQTPFNLPLDHKGDFLVAGDFNRDGKSDLAIADWTRVQVLLGSATGFNPPVNYVTYSADGIPAQAVYISIGDINGDGKDDLVVTIAGDTVLMLGDGSGNFTKPKNLGIFADYTLISDFNGDGKQDLALAKTDSVQILYGDGAGNFVAHKGGYYAGSAIGVVDVNKDGRPDIVALIDGLAVLTNVCNDGAAPTGNPIDEPQFFVRQHYYDFLSRPPDFGGLGYWTSQITRCASNDAACIHNKRLDVSNAFFYEQEFQSTGAYVYRMFKAAFGTRPTFAQFLPDRSLVIGGSQLDASKSQYTLVFVQRAEFVQRYPRTESAAQFVDALLDNIKQNSGVDLSSLRGQLTALYDGTDKGRAAILRQLADNQMLVDAEYNRSFVLMEYFGYLRRDPDQGGYDFWLTQVNKFPVRDVGIQHAMVCSFITSAEYQLRFSSIVTHSNRECPQ